MAVRRAFAQLIDRKNIVKAALNGLGQAVYGPIPLLAIRSNITGYRTDSVGSISIQDLYIKTK